MGVKANIVQIKTIELLKEITDFYSLDNNFENLNEIICGKHVKKMRKHKLKNLDERQREEIQIDINNNNILDDTQPNNETTDLLPLNDDSYRTIDTKSSSEFNEDQEYICSSTSDDDFLLVDLERTSNSHKYCFICKCESGSTPFTTIPNDAIMDVFIKKNIFIPLKSRCCGTHLTDGKFIKECELNKIEPLKSTRKFNKTSIKNFFDSVRVRDSKVSSIFARFGDFYNTDNEFCLDNTGLTKDEFIFLAGELTSLKSSPKRTKEQAMAVYLFWLKTGMSQELIACHFNLTNRFQVQKYCEQVRKAINSDFVMKHLGVLSRSREDWLNYLN